MLKWKEQPGQLIIKQTYCERGRPHITSRTYETLLTELCPLTHPGPQKSGPAGGLSTLASPQIFKTCRSLIQPLRALSGGLQDGSNSPVPGSIWSLVHQELLGPLVQSLDGWGVHKTGCSRVRDIFVLCVILLRVSASCPELYCWG